MNKRGTVTVISRFAWHILPLCGWFALSLIVNACAVGQQAIGANRATRNLGPESSQQANAGLAWYRQSNGFPDPADQKARGRLGRENVRQTPVNQSGRPTDVRSAKSTQEPGDLASDGLAADRESARVAYRQVAPRQYSSPSPSNGFAQQPRYPNQSFAGQDQQGYPQLPQRTVQSFGSQNAALQQPPAILGEPVLEPPQVARPRPAPAYAPNDQQPRYELPAPAQSSRVKPAMETIERGSPSMTLHNQANLSYSSGPAHSFSAPPIESFDASRPGAVLAHLSDGIRVSGQHLRDRPPTATERALQLKNENDVLRQELEALRLRVTSLANEVKVRDKAVVKAERLNQEANRANAMLRDSVSAYKVKLKTAQDEAQAIKQNADGVLEEIEATLDAVLVNTLSRNRRPGS